MSSANSTSKRRKALEQQGDKILRLKEQNKCDCTHTKKNGMLDLFRSSKTVPGEINYTCRACDKELNLKKIPEDTLQSACKTIDNACDIIKMSLNHDRDEDQKIREEVSDLQYRVRNNLARWYGAALKKNSGGKTNTRNSNSTISKPRVY